MPLLKDPNKKKAYEEAKKLFFHRASKYGFDGKQAWFLWEYLISSETLKKALNMAAELQKEGERDKIFR